MKPARYFYALATAFLLVAFQNCESPQPLETKATSVTTDLSSRNSGNGEPYGGKPTISAYVQNHTCKDSSGVPQPAPYAEIQVEGDQYTLVNWNCESKAQKLSASEVEEFVSPEIKDGVIFQGRVFLPASMREGILNHGKTFPEAQCQESGPSRVARHGLTNPLTLHLYSSFEVNIHSTYSGQRAAFAVERPPSSSGTPSPGGPKPVIEIFQNLSMVVDSLLAIWSGPNFELQIEKPTSMTGPLLAHGAAEFRFQGEDTAIEVMCPVHPYR